MAFGKITKQDLVDAGLDPDKFTTLIGTAVTKTDLEAIKTANDANKTALDEVKQSIAALTDLVSKGAVNKDQNNQNNNQNNNNNNETHVRTPEEELAEYLADPTGFINKKVGGLAGGAAVEFKRLSRDIAYKEAQRSLKGFSNPVLKAEIDEEWKKYTPEMLARNNGDPTVVIQQVHDMVLGRHHDEIMQDANKKDGKFNLVHSSSSGGGGGSNATNNTNTDNTPKLSDGEKALAAKFGMTEEEWTNQGKDMEKEEIERRKLPVGAGA